MFRSSAFDKHLEKATSITNLEPDWDSIMALCDCIKTNEIKGQKALESIRAKLKSTNPNVVLRSLEVLESCVKNCGQEFCYELGSRDFNQDFNDVFQKTKEVQVREKMIALLAEWSYAFRGEPMFNPIFETVKMLKNKGIKFPAPKETADAFFTSVTAPKWVQGPCCHRCRTEFSLVNRKHHCRACGQVFCNKCSSKTSPIIAMGFEEPVRVCEPCYDKLRKPERSNKAQHRNSTLKNANFSQNSPTSAVISESAEMKKREDELMRKEDEELRLALEASLRESESKNKPASTDYGIGSQNTNSSQSTQPKRSKSKNRSSKSKNKANHDLKINTDIPDENFPPEMERYLDRELWTNRNQQLDGVRYSPSPSAPAPSISSAGTLVFEPVTRKEFNIPTSETNGNAKQMVGNIDAQELEEFKQNLRSNLDTFINRLNLNKLRGRAISKDQGGQTMFFNLTNMHTKLVYYIQQTNDARANCERLQDKISQIRDGRAALDALKDEHRENIRRQQEEAERIKQAQMQQKLELMRVKKQEYLQFQRELAIQRMQEQERGLMMMRSGQQSAPNTWQAPQQVPQTQTFYPQQMQYAGGIVLPVSQTPSNALPIGTIAPVASMAPLPSQPGIVTSLSEMNVPTQNFAQPALPPQQFSQYGPQVMPQYSAQNVLPYMSQPTTVSAQYPGYGVPQAPVYVTQPQFVQQQPMGSPQVVPQHAPQQQPQPEQAPPPPAQVDEAPLINFD